MPTPEFIQKREVLFKTLVEETSNQIIGMFCFFSCFKFVDVETQYCYFLERAKEEKAIEITLLDGSIKSGVAWKTTPFEIAQSIR